MERFVSRGLMASGGEATGTVADGLGWHWIHNTTKKRDDTSPMLLLLEDKCTAGVRGLRNRVRSITSTTRSHYKAMGSSSWLFFRCLAFLVALSSGT